MSVATGDMKAEPALVKLFKSNRFIMRILPPDGSPFTVGYFIKRVKHSLVTRLPKLIYKLHRFNLIKLSEVSCRENSLLFDKSNTVTYNKAACFGEIPENSLLDAPVTIQTPQIEIIEMKDASVIGKTDFIIRDKNAIYPDYIDFQRDITPMEVHGYAIIQGNSSIQFLESKYKKKRQFDEVISLLGSCTGNYIHWITETLPKLPIIDQYPQYRHYPLLIDKELHANIRESLDVFNQYERPLITVEQWESVRANKIVYLTAPGYVPFDYRNKGTGVIPDIKPEHATFSAAAFDLLNKTVDETFPETNAKSQRLYLRRRSPLRRLLQQKEIEELLVGKGFTVIDPESMTFAEQVDTFRQAEMIIGQAGAALGNMVFAPKNCKVIVLAAYSPYSNFHYFSNLAGTLGHQLSYVFGESEVRRGVHPAHGNINISLSTINEALA